MFIDEHRLMPYLDAVKKARIARHALEKMAHIHDESRENFLRADAEYQRAYKELAEVAEALAQGA
jgi:hypothetical protein